MPRPLSGRRFADALKTCLAGAEPLGAAEAAKLVRLAERMKIAEADALVAVNAYWAGRNKLSAENRGRLERVFATLSVAPNTNRPAPARARASATQPEHASQVFLEKDAQWRKPGGPGRLVQDGVSHDDPVQGAVEDCFFIAAFSAVAHADPSRIERILRPTGDGTFTATFYGRRSHKAPLEPFDVVVDGKLPLWQGRLVYGHGSNRNELWPALMEKAYAKWKGDYLFCFDDVAGLPGDALAALLGKDPDVILVLPTSNADDVYARIDDALRRRGCVVAGTRSHDDSVGAAQLESGHEYTVLSVSTSPRGDRSVELRNPRGGTQTITLRAFLDHFDLVDLVVP